eukprot:TRINITY_DN2216_c0_g1_i1.p1 TRINITY_DN2216_c0_g1~~TRINITY_DN2216_c0_g1_i1.p1  ORF type:complete len:630 (-),score=121.26 TRINITY_DN2216_c0_g1_i1:419-2308(-)
MQNQNAIKQDAIKEVTPQDAIGPENGDERFPEDHPEKPDWKAEWKTKIEKTFLPKHDPVDEAVARFINAAGEDSENEQRDREDYGATADDARVRYVVDKPWFTLLGGVVIAGNAVTIGLETNAAADEISKGNDSASSFWYTIELIFCLVFLAELGLRLWYHRLHYFTNPTTLVWNWIDFFIVVISIIDTLILVPLDVGGQLQLITLLRFVRLMRLARLVRLLKLFKELWLMVSGLLNSLKTMGWICLVSFLFCFACGIVMTVEVGQNDDLYDTYYISSGGWDHELYFSTIFRSTFTMFQIMTLDQWNDRVVRHVLGNQPGMSVYLLTFVVMASFGLLSIMIGVVVENTLATAERDQAKARAKVERDRKHVFSQLQEIFELADADGSGTLTLDEVQLAVQKPEIYNKLKMIDFPVDEPEQIFALLDYDGSGELTTEEFISGCIRMKGGAKSKDLLVAQVAVDAMKKQYGVFEKELEIFREKVARLNETARSVIDHGEHVFLNERQYRHRHPEFTDQALDPISNSDFDFVPWQQEQEEEEEMDQEHQLALLENSVSPSKRRRAAPQLTDQPYSPKAIGNGINEALELIGQNSPGQDFGIQGSLENRMDGQLAIENGQPALQNGNLPGSLSN